MDKPKVTIRNTARVKNWGGSTSLTGNVYGHPLLPDGLFVRTSKIVQDGGDTVETLNTIYTVESTESAEGRGEEHA